MVDDIERVVIDNHDYRPMATITEPVLLLEWDIAVSKEDLARFAEVAAMSPDRVLVAPYMIYYEDHLATPMWAHRQWDGEPVGMANPVGAKPIDEFAPVCNLFGLGMCYLPAGLIARFVRDQWANHIGDVELSMWHFRRVEQNVPILWETRPVHLNYRLPAL